MAAEASKSSSSADSYIGSVISLTSKSEIRYEGVLYSINAEESSIGLRNVRSFGSEGRKKDGPQIPPSDRVYEYILFRGTDIKDLQVKSAPAVQATSMMDNDPAIIQSHYPPPHSTSTSFPAAASVSPTDVNFHTPQMGHPGSNFQGGMSLYHPGASLGSWGPSPPPINGNSLPVPLYWPGMYGLPNTLPPLHQQTFLQPHPGLSVPPTLQQPMPYSSLSAPPQAALNVASSSSTLPDTSSSSTNMGFNPPPLTGAMNGTTSSSPLLAATISSTALTSSSFLPLSLPVVPSLQQSVLYSGFSTPAPAAVINMPSSSSMTFPTNSSSAISGYNPPPPSIPMNVPSSGSINAPSSSLMSFTTNSSSAVLGYHPPPTERAMNDQSSDSPLLAVSSSSTPLTSSSLPSLGLPVVPSLTGASQTSSSSVFNKGLNSVHSLEARNVGLPSLASLTISDSETISVNPPQPATVVLSSSTPSEKEVLIPSLVTPGQLLQSKNSQVSSQSSQVAHKDVEVIQVSSSTEQSVLVPKEKEAQPPILPLPPAPRPYYKPNGAPQVRHNYRGSGRGRGRGRGIGGSRPVTRFTEDFDFSAMNEKFNKDEVWGHLGKSNKIQSNDEDGDEIGEDGYEDEDGAELPKIEVKPVYNKDDFFDTLSSNARDNGSQNARPRFSEQMKLDTETFGEFARYRGGRGGRNGRGSNYGRGNSYVRSGPPGRGYGYSGRGRGRPLSSQAS